MIKEQKIENVQNVSVKSKLADYSQLIKFRLTFTVVLSAAITFAIASVGQEFNSFQFFALIFGGFLVVASSNGLNQIIERNYDKLMERTNNRPVATNRMTVTEAAIFCTFTGIIGVFILGRYLNQTSALLGLFALLSYAFIYTPLKRVSPIAVFVGAFPGAIPAMLGWVAVTGEISYEAWLLFSFQFFWQFPHFWAIAWVLHDDYKKAGYQLLPSNGGRNKKSAFQTVLYTVVLIIISILPFVIGMVTWVSAVIALVAGVYFLVQAINLYKTCEVKEAKKLMFTSFAYLPLMLLVYLIDKLLVV